MGGRDLSFWVSEPVVKLVGYLVARRLVGAPIRPIWDYYVGDGSPSEIATKYGMSKYAVRGVVQRCASITCWRHPMIAEVVKVAVPVVERMVPTVVLEGFNGYAVCRLCGAWIDEDTSVRMAHIKRHKKFFYEEVTAVLEEILNQLGLRNGFDLRAIVVDVLSVKLFGRWVV